MGSRRLEDTPAPAHRRQAAGSLPLPPADAPRSARDLLLRSWPGRLFIVAVGVKLLIVALRAVLPLPPFVEALGTTASIGIVVALLYFLVRLFVLVQRRLLWRVRRKLILSYIFIGVVPALLIAGFFLFGAWILSMNVVAYLFRDGHDDVVRNVELLADAAVAEIGRSPAGLPETLERIQRNGSRALNYPAISLAFVPRADTAVRPATAGSWEHTSAPLSVPSWVEARMDGFAGTIAAPQPEAPGRAELIVRVVRPAQTRGQRIGHLIADLPINGQILDHIYEQTGVRAGSVALAGEAGPPPDAAARPNDFEHPFSLFRQSVGFFDGIDWESGAVRRVTISMRYELGDLYQRLARAQSTQLGPMSLANTFLVILVVVAALFFIIELAALTMGLALARSITSSIHELFMGTERVRLGDFTHRIKVRSKDQLGELAGSFNQMTGSIENLLQTAAEKKRLEEELRIARQIQMSLLPRGPLETPGLSVTALCVPAREVGGDYYDFFPLGHGKVGMLIADVSGKGTSAALYMAELKGLMLSLSQIHHSPRQLLLEVNRIISEHLDSRSFITMTYAVIDQRASTMTYARAGHTPLIYLRGGSSANVRAEVLTPDGMVLGLRIDGAAEKFAELLEEQELLLQPGDVIVLYTDGITEAMNASSDLFGESRLSRIVEEHGHLESGELRERILREIEAFVGGADQHDDMTMILIKVEAVPVAAAEVGSEPTSLTHA